jgi:hypothetical protein
MNERIKELENQCWEDIPVDIDYDYLSRVRRVFNREKFAELIIQECYLYISGEMGLMWDGGLKKTKQHFGVE